MMKTKEEEEMKARSRVDDLKDKKKKRAWK